VAESNPFDMLPLPEWRVGCIRFIPGVPCQEALSTFSRANPALHRKLEVQNPSWPLTSPMYLVAAEAQDASGVDPDSEILLLKETRSRCLRRLVRPRLVAICEMPYPSRIIGQQAAICLP
jgi:hypothetical protein